ncbi:hypothetical protein [Fusibacter sp. 3D3]|uniref:hypothetical protein n=1 Tax=Fusibacter sp. 3D3 TaxID=1048380 RepID=UPI000852E9C0|nr:hypothetical protein [Fusibacter sp. 3D3]GAU78676.1 hypothetical protein F3D3_3311 [Fusibacter sp. 3D3]
MKKKFSLIVVMAFIITSTFSSFADVGNGVKTYDELINDIVNYLEISSEGLLDVDKTLENISINDYSQKDISEIRNQLDAFNVAMKESNAIVDRDGILREKGNESKKTMQNVVVNSLPEGHKLIEEGMYWTENNIMRIYFSKDKALDMISKRDFFTTQGFIPTLIAGYFNFPVGVILSVGLQVASEESAQITRALNASGGNGVCLSYWKYNSSSRSWSPWYKGSIQGNDWTKY